MRRAAAARIVGLAVLFLVPTATLADEVPAAPLLDSGVYRPRLSLLDVPFNARAGVPSMTQSLDLGRLVVEGVDGAIDAFGEFIERKTKAWVRWLIEPAMLFTWSVVQAQLPLGATWVHEEWHRAVLSQYGVSSFDEMYLFHVFGNHAVSGVTDEGLERLKARSPADAVRMSSAGLEAGVVMTLQQQRDIFFDQRAPWRELPFIAWTRANAFLYLTVCLDAQKDQQAADVTDTNPAARDFTGYDCDAWMYDLERRDEPYAGRGRHPSGIGIARYRYVDQLSPAGRAFLDEARWLSLLNFASPQLFGLQRIPIPFSGGRGTWNVALTHQLAPFGQALGVNLFAQWGRLNLAVTYHHYFNARGGFPGVELEVVRWPLSPDLRGSVGVMFWGQPVQLRYDSASAQPGVLLRGGLSLRVWQRLRAFAEGDLKTDGWVEGNAYLGAKAQLRAGLEADL